MTRHDISKLVAKRGGYIAKEVDNIIVMALEEIRNAVANGEKVTLRGFATVHPHLSPAKYVRDISRGKAVTLPARYIPKFKPCKQWREELEKKQ